VRIAVHLTVDVDPADWTRTFGVTGAQAIRDDVRKHIRVLAEDQIRDTICRTATIAMTR